LRKRNNFDGGGPYCGVKHSLKVSFSFQPIPNTLPGTVGIYDFGNRLYEPALFPNTPPGTVGIYDFMISERDFMNQPFTQTLL
jgi:hypothetical protein